MSHIILANWKMAPESINEAKTLFNVIKSAVLRLRAVTVIIAPPALFLHTLASSYGGNKIGFSAQSISEHEGGAHTGSQSAKQFSTSGAGYTLVGHSERRKAEGLGLDGLRIKTFLAIKHGLAPVVFVGEEERDSHGAYLNLIREQMLAVLKELSDKQLSDVIFCYEPVWAIGKSEAMDAYDVHAMALYMRKVLIEEYGAGVARKVQILYGGSVNPANIASILAISDIDGVAVGRASIDADKFVELLKIANKV